LHRRAAAFPGGVGVGDARQPAITVETPVLGGPVDERQPPLELAVRHLAVRAAIEAAGRSDQQDDPLDAFRASGRDEASRHTAFGRGDDRRTLEPRRVHDGHELFDAHLDRRRRLDRVRGTRPGLVIHSDSREPPERREERARLRVLPELVHV